MVKFFTTMEVLHLAVICAVLFKVNGNTVDVSAGENVNVRLNEEADLSCTTSRGLPISICNFISPTEESYYVAGEGVTYEDRITSGAGCSIKIKNVMDKDDGEWHCDITSIDGGVGKTGRASISLTVLKAPKSVSLEPATLDVVDPEDGEKTIKCIAEGGHPAPTFSWTLNGEPAKISVINSNTEGDGAFFEEVVYKPNKADDGKVLECVAKSEAYTPDDLSAEINKAKATLNVAYKPVPAKDVYEFYGLTVGQPFEIRISFRANPTPSDMRWKMHDGIEVPQGSQDEMGKYTSAIFEGPVEGESLYTALLTINNVVPEDADTLNTLQITNQHGTSEIQFKLALGDKPPVEAGAGGVIAIIIIILIVIVVIAVVVVARSQGLLCFAVPSKSAEEDKEKAVEKEEGSDTESADQNEPAKTEADGEPAQAKKSIPARMTSLLSAMKKTVGGTKKASNPAEAEELKQGEEKVEEVEGEKKDDIVYADLDKSAMSEGNATLSVENEKTEYAEIKPN